MFRSFRIVFGLHCLSSGWSSYLCCRLSMSQLMSGCRPLWRSRRLVSLLVGPRLWYRTCGHGLALVFIRIFGLRMNMCWAWTFRRCASIRILEMSRLRSMSPCCVIKCPYYSTCLWHLSQWFYHEAYQSYHFSQAFPSFFYDSSWWETPTKSSKVPKANQTVQSPFLYWAQ